MLPTEAETQSSGDSGTLQSAIVELSNGEKQQQQVAAASGAVTSAQDNTNTPSAAKGAAAASDKSIKTASNDSHQNKNCKDRPTDATFRRPTLRIPRIPERKSYPLHHPPWICGFYLQRLYLSLNSVSYNDGAHLPNRLPFMKYRGTPNREASVQMGEYDGAGYTVIDEVPSSPRTNNGRKVSVLPLVFLIFYEVSGGPFGVEDSVHAAGPLLALVGFLVFPIIWSVPEALITAEMGTMFPENGGYVVWVSSALGPYWGFQQGWMKWLSGVIDNALYPVLFLDYLKSEIPALGGGFPRIIAVLALTLVLTYMNYRGLTIVGWVAVLLGIFSILPFVVMGLISIPKLKPERWLVVDVHNIDWNLYLNTIFWNLNYWDSISTLAGEVHNPNRTLPKALFYALILVVLGYFFPLLTGTGAIPLQRDSWTDGYFSDIAKILGGAWLSWWIQGAAAMSNMGMFVAEMSSDSFQLLGMAERGMLPEFFAKRSRHGTPLIGILFSASGVILLSWLSFQEIVAAENFLYCFGMILEFIAFVWLRIKSPDTPRPYKIPVGTIGAILMCVPPTLLIGVVLAFSSLKVLVISLGAIVIGLVMQPGLRHVEKKRWLKFSVSSDLPDIHQTTRESSASLI